MKLPWQKSDGSTAASAVESPDVVDTEQDAAPAEKPLPKGYTPPKGKPTPKRRDREIERGVIRDPNAMSTAQASQRRKDLKKSMTKEEWKEFKAKERAETRERNRMYQERMAAGDERYLPANERGEERRYARDWIDSRRFLMNYAMPLAFLLLVVMGISTFAPALSGVLSLLSMLFIFLMFTEGIITGNRLNKAVREKFPGTDATGFSIGFYGFSRASQPRRWRTPRPRVEIGEKV